MDLSQIFHDTSPELSVDDRYRLARIDFIAYAVIFFTVVIWCHYKWKRRPFEKLASMLPGPPSYPIVGSGLLFAGSPQQVMDSILKLVKDYGIQPFQIWLGSRFTVMIAKPEDLQIVLNSSKALEKDNSYRFLEDVLGQALLTASVHKWRRNRRLITPVFNAKLLEHFFPVFNEKNRILVRNLKKEVGKTQPFDLWNYIANTALDIICQTAMGYNVDTQSKVKSEYASAFLKSIELVSMRIYKPWLYPDIIFSIYVRLLGLQNVFKTLHTLPNKVIQEMQEAYNRKKVEKNAIDVTDGEKNRLKVFLDTLLELNKGGEYFSPDELREEVNGMIIGGSETTAVTVCFCLLMLAIHPDIQDQIYDEIYDVLGDDDRPITIEDTTNLVYLEQTLRETLRLFPVAPVMLRNLQDDVKIASGNYVLPKGTTCVIGPIFTHHSAELYPNPLTFNPENFNPENVNKRHKYSFIAFSGGPRNCIGYKYGILSMKVFISSFLRNYSVHTDVKMSDIKLKIDLVIRSVHGYPVTIRTRDRRPTYKRNQTVEATNC